MDHNPFHQPSPNPDAAPTPPPPAPNWAENSAPAPTGPPEAPSWQQPVVSNDPVTPPAPQHHMPWDKLKHDSAPAVPSSLTTEAVNPNNPVPVVHVLSTRGVEYVFMALALWFGAGSLIGVLLSLINSGTDFGTLAFPVSVLIVCIPVFAYFFLRLKKAEIAEPSLRQDPSKRRSTQITQVFAFLTCLFTLIGFVFFVMSKIAGESESSLWKAILDVLAILAVAGGVLAYYWIDEHRAR